VLGPESGRDIGGYCSVGARTRAHCGKSGRVRIIRVRQRGLNIGSRFPASLTCIGAALLLDGIETAGHLRRTLTEPLHRIGIGGGFFSFALASQPVLFRDGVCSRL
jgi:hypothetical protein